MRVLLCMAGIEEAIDSVSKRVTNQKREEMVTTFFQLLFDKMGTPR